MDDWTYLISVKYFYTCAKKFTGGVKTIYTSFQIFVFTGFANFALMFNSYLYL